MRHAVRLTCTFAAVLALAACAKSPGEALAEAAIEAGTGQQAEVDADTGAVTFKTDEGDMKVTSGPGATLPASFPKDVYLPASYKVGSTMEMPGALVIEVDAPGTVAATFAEADAKMIGAGWKQRMAVQQSAESQVAIYEKQDRDATLSIYDNAGNGVKVGVQVTTKQ